MRCLNQEVSRQALLALSFLEDFDGKVGAVLSDVPLHRLFTSLHGSWLRSVSELILLGFYGLWLYFTMALTNGVSRTSLPIQCACHSPLWGAPDATKP